MNSNYNTPNNNSSKGWALGFGLLAGVALGYYLNSNEGRAARRKAQVRFDEYGNQISEYSTQVTQQAKERVNTLSADAKVKLAEGKQWASNTVDSVKNTVNEKTNALKASTNDTVSSVQESFNRGVSKAKTRVNNGTEA